MFKFIVIVSMLFFTVFNSYAEPITLKCVTSEGLEAADLTIDIKNKVLIWAKYIEYDIFHIDKNYISAYERSQKVGGEVWVIDRRSGDYKRAFVAMTIHKGQKPEDAKLTADTYSGRCVKSLF